MRWPDAERRDTPMWWLSGQVVFDRDGEYIAAEYVEIP